MDLFMIRTKFTNKADAFALIILLSLDKSLVFLCRTLIVRTLARV